jgi:hypothetical protein
VIQTILKYVVTVKYKYCFYFIKYSTLCAYCLVVIYEMDGKMVFYVLVTSGLIVDLGVNTKNNGDL